MHYAFRAILGVVGIQAAATLNVLLFLVALSAIYKAIKEMKSNEINLIEGDYHEL